MTIEALGTQGTFESALQCLRPGGTLASLAVYPGKLKMPYDVFAAGLGATGSSRRNRRDGVLKVAIRPQKDRDDR